MPEVTPSTAAPVSPAVPAVPPRPPAALGFAILLPHIRRHWWLPALTLLALLVSSAAQIGLAWSLKLVIDAVTAHDARALAFAVATVVVIALAMPPAQSLMQMTRSVFGGRLARELRGRVFTHLLRAPASFHDRRHSGELQSRLADDVGSVEGMVANDFVNLLQQPLLALASFGYLLTLNAWMALAVAALGPAMYLLDRLWGPGLYGRSRRVREAGARLSQFAVDTLGGIQPIKALRAEDAIGARYGELCGEQYAARVGEWSLGNLTGSVSGWMSFAPFVIIFALGGLWASEGRLSLGTLIAAVQLMNNVVSPFGTLAAAWRGLQTGRASLDRLGELLAAKPEPGAGESTGEPDGDREPEAAASSGPGSPAPVLRLQGVRFGYTPERPVLQGLSASFPAGAFTAVVGPNGSGKSTLAKLLLRFYDPDGGAITWNGAPLGDMPARRVRQRTAYLPQEPFLMDARVADNLRLGAPAASDAELRRALADVGLPADDAFLALEVGERGKRLSGGQRLRLALARALLADAPLWILDEPSAALDAEAATALRRTLEGLRGTRTVVAISHSRELVEGADHVVSLGGASPAVQGAARQPASEGEGIPYAPTCCHVEPPSTVR